MRRNGRRNFQQTPPHLASVIIAVVELGHTENGLTERHRAGNAPFVAGDLGTVADRQQNFRLVHIQAGHVQFENLVEQRVAIGLDRFGDAFDLSFGKNNDLFTKAIIRLHHLNLIEASI